MAKGSSEWQGVREEQEDACAAPVHRPSFPVIVCALDAPSQTISTSSHGPEGSSSPGEQVG